MMETSIPEEYDPISVLLKNTIPDRFVDLIPDLLHYRLFPFYGRHFGGQISIAFNGVKGRGSYFTKTCKASKLILHYYNK